MTDIRYMAVKCRRCGRVLESTDQRDIGPWQELLARDSLPCPLCGGRFALYRALSRNGWAGGDEDAHGDISGPPPFASVVEV